MFNRIKKYYKGFSTKKYEEAGKQFDVYNVECIQEDLLNAIFTLRGERLMMPTYGTRIPLLVFELDDNETVSVVKEDLTTVFKNDPRVELLNMDIFNSKDKNALVVVCKLRYIEFDVTKDLQIEISG
jgi:phage baseplate assembly protein W